MSNIRCMDLNDSDPICRYINLRDLILWIETQKTSLTRVKSWDDPYEFPICRMLENSGLPKKQFEESTDAVYAQCWCRSVPSAECSSPDCDAMWTKYSQNHQGLMIKTSVNKLRRIFEPLLKYATLGPVQYSNEIDIKSGDFSGPATMEVFAPSYIKRSAFRYEHEVRLVTNRLYVYEIADESNDRIFLNVDPKKLALI